MRRLFAVAGVLAMAIPLSAQQTPAARRAAIEVIYPVMVNALENGNFGQARNICDQAILWEPENPVHYYNLACIEARAGPARRTHALPALQRAASLGFAEVRTLQSDPDLDSVRGDPLFAEIVRVVAANATARAKRNASSPAKKRAQPSGSDAAGGSPETPEGRGLAGAATLPLAAAGLGRPLDLAALTNVEPPAPASYQRDMPVGLYFMTRLLAYAGTVEKQVWYFAPNGMVYQGLEHGFSAQDLAAHRGPKGTAQLAGDVLQVRWNDGRRSTGRIARDDSGFSWDRGNFVPAKPFSGSSAVAGRYEGAEAMSVTGNRAAIGRALELRPDGTFRWAGVSLINPSADLNQVQIGSNGRETAGRWRADGFVMVLVDTDGRIYRRIAFPHDNRRSTPGPDELILGGTLYQKRGDSALPLAR